MSTFIKGDPDAPVPEDGTTVVYDGVKGAYVPGPPPGSGTSVTVTDNGDGSVTLTGSLTGSITDNGDGSVTI